MHKFRLDYEAQNGERRLISEDNRFIITLNGEILENYGSKENPLWETIFDTVPPTIQMFTGVKDKNGKEIYEGDRMLYYDKIGIVKLFAGSFILEYDDQTDDFLSLMTVGKMEVL